MCKHIKYKSLYIVELLQTGNDIKWHCHLYQRRRYNKPQLFLTGSR